MREIPAPFLTPRTTLRVGGNAIAEIVLEHRDDLYRLPERLRVLGGTPLVLGAGSNILAQDGELPLVLIRPGFEDGPEIAGEEDGKVLVRVGAGVPMARLLRFCAVNGLSGLEGLVGIPGSVGGAVAMNAGSHGSETCKNILKIQVFIDNAIHTVTASSLQYGYRTLCISDKKNDFIVLEAIFGLTSAERDGICNCMRHNFFKKKSKQPVTAWSAGCVFKNPTAEMSAGRLLDQAGFKGKKLGGMAFSTMHANFLINEGKGSATAALALLREAQETVLQRFGIVLEPEVRIVPCLLP
jgi:UDP-N-acetylmuramate dehydrogenase